MSELNTDEIVRMTGEPVGVPLILNGHTDRVLSVSYSHDGTRIVSGSGDGRLRIWNAETGEPIQIGDTDLVLRGHSDAVKSVSYSPDDTRIVSGSDDKTLRLWDAVTGEPIQMRRY